MNFDNFLINKYLKTGIVEFSYLKKDGSERIARGTLFPKLLPPPEPKRRTFKVIVEGWKTTDDVELPDQIKVQLPVDLEGDDVDLLNRAIIEHYGYEPAVVKYEEIFRKERAVNPNVVVYFDLDKHGFRSFEASQVNKIINFVAQ